MQTVPEEANMKSLIASVMCISLAIFTSFGAIADDGGSTYRMVCSSCHGSGIFDAPTLKDKAGWKPRLAKGMESLYAPVTNGNCKKFVLDLRKDLNEESIKAAIDYMVAQVR